MRNSSINRFFVLKPIGCGGEGGIRTHGTVARTTVFETVPIDHSGTSPNFERASIGGVHTPGGPRRTSGRARSAHGSCRFSNASGRSAPDRAGSAPFAAARASLFACCARGNTGRTVRRLSGQDAAPGGRRANAPSGRLVPKRRAFVAGAAHSRPRGLTAGVASPKGAARPRGKRPARAALYPAPRPEIRRCPSSPASSTTR